jgi:hypothetical protein
MEYLVPNLNYAAHLDVINAQMRELEEDLPELSYYRQKELGSSITGKAVRLLLSQAVDRTIEARGNIETGLARADAMALTMGVNAGLFRRIGTYERGDFEHTFAEREVIPFSTQEQAETLKTEVDAGIPLVTAARRRGWTEAELKQMATDFAAGAQDRTADLADGADFVDKSGERSADVADKNADKSNYSDVTRTVSAARE